MVRSVLSHASDENCSIFSEVLFVLYPFFQKAFRASNGIELISSGLTHDKNKLPNRAIWRHLCVIADELAFIVKA